MVGEDVERILLGEGGAILGQKQEGEGPFTDWR